MNKAFVLKIGGSVLYDELLNLNTTLLDKVKDWYGRASEEYEKIVIVVGGGNLSRDVQEKVAGAIGGKEYLHSIGMSVTQTNASIVRGYLGDPDVYEPKKLGDAYEYLWKKDGKVLVCGGLQVGWSTDMDAAVFADILDTDMVYKLSNIDYLYDKDPKKYSEAQSIQDISWDEYFSLFNISDDSFHKPNENVPIDISCARFSKSKGISFHISGGKNLYEKERVEDIVKEGTLIHP